MLHKRAALRHAYVQPEDTAMYALMRVDVFSQFLNCARDANSAGFALSLFACGALRGRLRNVGATVGIHGAINSLLFARVL